MTDDESPAICPRCTDVMSLPTGAQTGASYCSRCRGIWFPGAVLEHHLGNLGPSRHFDPSAWTPVQPGPVVACPQCNSGRLVLLQREGVEIDRCNRCKGVFLDAGEFESLVETLPESAQAKPILQDPTTWSVLVAEGIAEAVVYALASL